MIYADFSFLYALKWRGGFESWFVTCSMWVVVMFEWKWMSIDRRKYSRVFWLLCQKLRSWWVIQIVWILFSISHLHLRCRQSLNPDFGPRFGFKQAKTETDSSRACSAPAAAAAPLSTVYTDHPVQVRSEFLPGFIGELKFTTLDPAPS